MAEEEPDDMEDGEEEEEDQPIQGGMAACQRRRKHKEKSKCNPRIDELAKPRKWMLLALWREHAKKFEVGRMEAIRQRIQEEFCMSPEETEAYVKSLKKYRDTNRQRREIAKEIRKEKAIAKIEAQCIFRKFLKKAMMYACTNVAPPLVSPMLRYMSESILVLLSEIHCIPAPKRCDKSNQGQFLLALADWAAIFLAHIYYEVDRDENKEIEKLKEMERIAAEEEAEEEEEDQGKGKSKRKSSEKAVDHDKVETYEGEEGETVGETEAEDSPIGETDEEDAEMLSDELE